MHASPPLLPRCRQLSLLSFWLLACGIAPAFAQDDQAELLKQIQLLRNQQQHISALQSENEASLRALETRLGVAAPKADALPLQATPLVANLAGTLSAAATTGPSPAVATAADVPRLKISGDLRVRAQHDSSDSDRPNRSSSQVRARLGATYAVNDRVSVGARLVTGDADDPNSTDVQLSNWNDDLQVSLDQAYVQLNYGDLKLYGGKMPQPFTRTELVWDGDVNPQGLAATYRHALDNGAALRANGLFFVVNESAGGADSTMLGAQVGFDTRSFGQWKYDVSAAYFDYSLGSLAGGDAGDWRGNLLNPDGNFVSDFRLANLIAGASYQGFGERWPLRVVGDYVQNTGARTDADTGYGLDLLLGRISKVGDWRFGYGYAMAETDAVLTAFSQDNIGIASNYRLHSFSLDYVPSPKTVLSAVWYRYRPQQALDAGTNDPADWLNRVRLAFLVNF